MALFKIFKGAETSLSSIPKHEGYCYFCQDTGNMYVDIDNNTRVQVNAHSAEFAAAAAEIASGSNSVEFNSGDLKIKFNNSDVLSINSTGIISGVGTPINNTDAATKAYVDSATSSIVTTFENLTDIYIVNYNDTTTVGLYNKVLSNYNSNLAIYLKYNKNYYPLTSFNGTNRQFAWEFLEGSVLKKITLTASSASDLQGTWATPTSILSVSSGGTGGSSFTANRAILSGANATGGFVTRPITNNTSATAASSGSTNLITQNTLYYATASINNARQTSAISVYAPTTGGTANQILVSSGSTSAPTWKATDSGAAYATATNGALTFGTLPVAQGGTGATTFTAGAALIGAGTSAVTTRSITNITNTNTSLTANTNLITANTLKNMINRSSSVTAATKSTEPDTAYMMRGEAIDTIDNYENYTIAANSPKKGQIVWFYG